MAALVLVLSLPAASGMCQVVMSQESDALTVAPEVLESDNMVEEWAERRGG